MLMVATTTPTSSTYASLVSPAATLFSTYRLVILPWSVTTRWAASTAVAGSPSPQSCSPVTDSGDSACLRAMQRRHVVALRDSAAMATRSAPVHQLPGRASLRQ